MNKSQTLKGFRDFLPEEKIKRDFVANKIKEIFERFGFDPLETPTLEYAQLLLGKYGDEADKLIYTFTDRGGRSVGLRYDQTVPTARVLTQYQDVFYAYFKRYQIQNVFRADKPQKGRFREFTQCDIDIFGSNSPTADAEILACAYAAYKNIGFENVVLNINSREDIHNRLESFTTHPLSDELGNTSPEIWKKRANSFLQTVDKLDKMGKNAVVDELKEKGFAPYEIAILEDLLKIQDERSMSTSLGEIVAAAQELGVPKESLVYSPLMVRGLDYYTGMIFEVNIPDYTVGSVGGGGRYDHLIRDLGGPDISAVGMAFGFDRTVEAAELHNLVPKNQTKIQILVTTYEDKHARAMRAITKRLRDSHINTDFSPNPEDKLEKQLKYADKKGIPYVIIQGPDEANRNVVKLKNMKTQEQQELSIEAVIDKIKNL